MLQGKQENGVFKLNSEKLGMIPINCIPQTLRVPRIPCLWEETTLRLWSLSPSLVNFLLSLALACAWILSCAQPRTLRLSVGLGSPRGGIYPIPHHHLRGPARVVPCVQSPVPPDTGMATLQIFSKRHLLGDTFPFALPKIATPSAPSPSETPTLLFFFFAPKHWSLSTMGSGEGHAGQILLLGWFWD